MRRRFNPVSLDALNFLLADVRGALGPYLNVFLVTQQHWSQSAVGLVTTLGGFLGLAVQTPIGGLIDATRAKRALIVAALMMLSTGAVTIYAAPIFWPVMIANCLIAIVGDVFGPAVAALTLGLYPRAALARRMGRNSAFDHGGNVAIAAAAGFVGWALSQRAVFLLVPFFAALASLAVLSIPAGAIDHVEARGGEQGDESGPHPSGLGVLLTCRPLLLYAGCAMLFHFANAPLLPLVGQKLALAHREWATAMMSACIIAAQMIMLPIALLVGWNADRWGRKPILLIGFGILPVRAVLYTFSNSSVWLIGVQLLDGIGAGIFGAITPLVLADLMRGTGRYNVAQGAIATAQGIGAAASGLAAGLIVDHFGYSAAFLTSGASAAVAFAALSLVMPETAPSSDPSLPERLASATSEPLMPGRDPCLSRRARNRRSAVSWGAGIAALALIAAIVFLIATRWLGIGAEVASNPAAAAAIAIFAGTYIVIAAGKLPGFYLDRAGAALLGASLMVGMGVLTLDQALRSIDFDTIALLLGMMIVVGNLRLSGFFRLVTNWVVTRARHPLLLLAAVIITSGFFSAFLVNDTVCLALTPLVLDLVLRLRRNPAPYLLAVAMASNAGSVATITGNPQNIMIGSFSRIPYGAFAATLSPVAAIGLAVTFALIALFHPSEFWTSERLRAAPTPVHAYRPLAIKTVVVALAMMAGFFAGLEPAKLALIAGSVLLVTREVRSEKIYREIDWPLLLMFAGLFIVVSGFEKVLLSPQLIAEIGHQHLDRMPVLAAVTAALSNLVSNVPAVLVLKPFVTALPGPQRAWLVAAMAATLAGNLTILGSVANLIVVQRAARRGVTIGFWQYFRVGAPVTVLTILVGLWWL